MHTTNCRKFKGEIEIYLAKEKNIFKSRIDRAFRMLHLKTKLNQTKIRKKEGHHPARLLFIVTLLTLFKISTIHGFCRKNWYHWCSARKDAFYQFKQASCRWRSFLYAVITRMFDVLQFEQHSVKKRYLVIDDSPIPKRSRKIENVSFIYDHNLGRSILGFPLVTLGLFTEKHFYPVDFAYRFGKARHPKNPEDEDWRPQKYQRPNEL